MKDFDVWSFYAALGDGPYPYRWRGTADFDPSKFGRYPGDPPTYTGRRVDFLGRSLPAPLEQQRRDPRQTLPIHSRMPHPGSHHAQNGAIRPTPGA